MDVLYRTPLPLHRLGKDSAKRWFIALAAALLITGSVVYYGTQEKTSTYATKNPATILTLEPLFAHFVFPTKIAVRPVNIATSMNRRTAVRAVRLVTSTSNATAGSLNSPASTGGSTVASPTGATIE